MSYSHGLLQVCRPCPGNEADPMDWSVGTGPSHANTVIGFSGQRALAVA